MLCRRFQVFPWLIVSAVCFGAIGTLSLSPQAPAGARPAFSIPLPANQEVGVMVQDITPSLASAFGLKEKHGAVVTALDVGSIQAGDVILSVNGQNVSNRRSLETVLAGISPSDALVFQVSRNGETHEVAIQRTAAVAARSEGHPIPQAIAPGFTGVRVEDANEQEGGIVVTVVDKGTPAEAAGLRLGDVIVDVNHVPIQNVAQFLSLVDKLRGQRVDLGVRRQGIYSVVVVPSFY